MAQFGGNKNPPWAQGGRAGQPGGGAVDVPGLAGVFGATAAAGPPPPSVFHPQGGPPTGIPPGLAGVGHLGVNHGPAVTLAAMASQPGVYPRPLGPGGLPGGPLFQPQQQPQVMLQQPPPQQQPPQQQPQQGQPAAAATQRVFTGTVTKLHDNFGFVDEDVFFQTTVVKGQPPRVNDRVLVEAAYNANMPFKWNATRIQVLPNQNNSRGPGPNPNGSGQVQVPPPSSNVTSVTSTTTLNAHAFANAAPSPMSHPPPPPRNTQPRNEAAFGNGPPPVRGSDHRNDNRMRNASPMRDSMKNRPLPSSDRRREDRSSTRDRDRENRDRSRDKDKDRNNSRSSPSIPSRKRSRSPRRTRSRSRSRSPPRRRIRTAPRYNVSVPKVSLNFPESGVHELKKRYSNMYVPSDFCMADHSWMKSFPVHDGFKIQYASTYHIFNKELVESPLLSDAVYDPTDADHTFNAKVMLLAVPPPNVLIEKTCQLAESSATNRDNLVHPTRAIQFLVGTRGKNETQAIGGPWSPSLDGPNPESDPSVLIRTAIRVCRALTGIDLSNCTQWHRFLEIHYRRQESSSKPARTETTVIFLPDVWSVMPTVNEHSEAKSLYEKALDAKINPPKPSAPVVNPEETQELEEDPKAEDEVTKAEDENEESVQSEEAPEKMEDAAATEPEQNGDDEEKKAEPTPWQNLDVKAMKVTELRQELDARGINSKGLKSQLAVRLQKAVKDEQEKEENPVEETKEEPETTDEKMEEEAPEEEKNDEEPEVLMEKPAPAPPPVKELDEKQKTALKSAYKFPSDPSILVHPHPKAKSGKFDCTVMSLSVLLDYRTEDNKESTFEVSLFAELFNEMLMRDSGFKLYKVILNEGQGQAEKKEEEKKAEASEKPTDKTEDKKTEEKIVTKDRDLLLACSYFDLGHCGYFETKDLEDILTTINLNLSRAQIKKLVTKVTAGNKDQQVNYRQFTDKPENAELKALENSEDNEEVLGLGFKAFLPKKEVASSNQVGSLSDGICSYRGSVVDVGKLLGQLKRSEKARSDTESQLKSAQKTVQEYKEATEKFNSSKEKLQAEVKDLKKQLKRVEDDMKRSQTDSSKYYAILKDIHSKVHPAVNAPTSPTPSKESVKKEEPSENNDQPSVNGKSESPTDE